MVSCDVRGMEYTLTYNQKEQVEQPDLDLSNGNLELLDPVSNVLLNHEE